MLSCSNISVSFENTPVLKGVDFKIGRKDRIGLVGANGVGKSTLLKVLAGKIEPENGSVSLDSGSIIGYLPQEFTDDELGLTPVELIQASLGFDIDAGYRSDLEKECSRLNFDSSLLARRVGELSGGERSKVALLRLLFSYYDLYLLDEPTNNLDLAGLSYLEEFITGSTSSFVIVSHDRKFLDRVVNRVAELSEYTGKVKFYQGGYSDYLREKEADIERQWAQYKDYRGRVRELESSIRTKKQWADTGANKPNLPDNDKFVRGKARDYAAGSARAAKNLERQLQNLQDDPIQRPKEKLPLSFVIEQATRSGDVVYDLKEVTKKLPEGCIGPVDLLVGYGERIALLGRNGIGKSTLLNVLYGATNPDGGSIRRGSQLRVGYLEQFPFKNESISVLDAVLPHCDNDQTEARRILSWFGLAEDVKRPVRMLSPGERSRLILASLVAGKPNCLLLDEPSNHLDLEAITSLERALSTYSGTVVVVSHDRYFLDQMRPTKTYLMGNDSQLKTINDYEAYEHEA